MYYRLTLILFVLCNISFAQLSVRNNAYVFINDQIVFVEDDINLNETNSRIYLRNEAQVIQGSGTTGNTGVGELSVYQEGNVGEYEYNYWCSPVGSKVSSSNNNPSGISLLNDVTGLITSVPATFNNSVDYNGTSSPLNIEPYWIWKFVASDQYADWVHVQDNTIINPGEGFTMKGTLGSGEAQRYDFRGKPNKGTIAVNVTTNNFTLVGNPYPSALDAYAYIHDPDNRAVINGTLFFWEQDPSADSHNIAQYEGGYATYTISNTYSETFVNAVFNTYNGDGSWLSLSGNSGSKAVNRYIPIGQGFMVEAIANGVVRAKNSHRAYIKETSANSQFFKTENITTKASKTNSSEEESLFTAIPGDHKRFRLNIDFNDTYTRQIVETFHHTATPGFDYGFEIKMHTSETLDSDAYFKSEGEDIYLAEALPFDPSLKIPFELKIENDNTPIRVRIVDVQHFDTNQPIYIHDKEQDSYVNLKEQHFNITLNADTYSDRFEIVFTSDSDESTALNTQNYVFDGLTVYQDNNNAEFKIANPNYLDIKSLNLYDIQGKNVFEKSISNNNNTYNYSTRTLKEGVYIAKITLEDENVLSKKIVVLRTN